MLKTASRETFGAADIVDAKLQLSLSLEKACLNLPGTKPPSGEKVPVTVVFPRLAARPDLENSRSHLLAVCQVFLMATPWQLKFDSKLALTFEVTLSWSPFTTKSTPSALLLDSNLTLPKSNPLPNKSLELFQDRQI